MSTKFKVQSSKFSSCFACSLFSILFFLSSCENNALENQVEILKNDSLITEVVVPKGEIKIIEPTVDDNVVILTKEGVTLTEIKTENNSEATIKLNTKQFKEGENHLSFSVSGVQNYSISYLANNYSLNQFTSNIFEVDFLYGNNVFLAFLTDKSGISIKTNKGCVLKNAVLGGVESLFNMDQPHLFYHLPHANNNESILDFHLVNTSISEHGNKVKVTVNGVEFILKKWAPYKIDGLKKSGNTLRIQLIDNKGDFIDGPFNDSGERSFSISSNT